MEIKGKFLVNVKVFSNKEGKSVAYSTPITKGDDVKEEKITSYLKVFLSEKAKEVFVKRENESWAILDVSSAWLTPYNCNGEVRLSLFINECALSEKKQEAKKPAKRSY